MLPKIKEKELNYYNITYFPHKKKHTRCLFHAGNAVNLNKLSLSRPANETE